MSQPAPGLITAANLLTYSRLVLLPFVIAGVVTGHGYLAVGAMLLVWITDLLDGRLARRFGQSGRFGKVLDSTVDFVLIYLLFIAFYAAGRLETYQFAVLYLGFVTILTLQLAQVAAGGEGLASTRLGKVTGALEYAYIIFLVVREVLPTLPVVAGVNYALFAALAIAIVLHGVECVLHARALTGATPEAR